MTAITRVLVVEDDPVDAARVRRALGVFGVGSPFALERVGTLQAGLDRLAKGDVGAVLLDLHLPDSRGVDTVVRLREHDPAVPLVVFTVAGDERTALAALQAGAQDYLVKDELSGGLLRRSIRYAIERRRLAVENERLERRVREAEKAESLGALSAGIAFSFNELLGTIFDRCDRALAEELGALEPRRRERLGSAFLEIHRAAFRAAELVTRLRDYAALAPEEPGDLELASGVLENSPLLEEMVPRSIETSYDVAGDALRVRVGRLELYRILTGLALNAVEAIGKQPGRISISTGSLDADERILADTRGFPDPRPGRYAFLRVADTGRGLDPEARRRIFDPFYSTKFAGRGLGLASVVGILERRRAVVRVEPQHPCGTAFTILFPLPEGDASTFD